MSAPASTPTSRRRRSWSSSRASSRSTVTVRGPFFKALATVGSAFEQAKVLKTVLQRTDLSPEARTAACSSPRPQSARTSRRERSCSSSSRPIRSRDRFARRSSAPSGQSVQLSSAERSCSSWRGGRICRTNRRSSLLRSAQGVSSNFERAQVLLAVASTQPLSRAGRDAYIDAAEKLGDFEQGRVLSALVKNERRTPAR